MEFGRKNYGYFEDFGFAKLYTSVKGQNFVPAQITQMTQSNKSVLFLSIFVTKFFCHPIQIFVICTNAEFMFIKVNLLVCYVFTQPIIVIVKKLNEKIEKKMK